MHVHTLDSFRIHNTPYLSQGQVLMIFIKILSVLPEKLESIGEPKSKKDFFTKILWERVQN